MGTGHQIDGDTTFESIDRDECLSLVTSQVIGRVAVADYNAAPLVVPVNFVLDGETVLFRTDAGSKFRLAVVQEQPISFQVDGVDPGRRSGWSVLVQGSAKEADPDELRHLPISPWAPGRKDRWVRIVPASVTGRRIRLAGGSGDRRGYL